MIGNGSNIHDIHLRDGHVSGFINVKMWEAFEKCKGLALSIATTLDVIGRFACVLGVANGSAGLTPPAIPRLTFLHSGQQYS